MKLRNAPKLITNTQLILQNAETKMHRNCRKRG